MKRKILLAAISVFGLVMSACSQNENSFNSDSSKEESSSADETSSDFSYAFSSKQPGLTLDEITEEVNKMEAQENKAVRYTFRIEERLTGTYPISMNDGSVMAEGEYSLDLVTEYNNSGSPTGRIITGTPMTENQRFFASYSSAVTARGWLSYHSMRRKNAENFEERFYTNPLTLWMAIWGNEIENAQIDGDYFGLEEYEKVYNAEGYCVSFMIHEFHYMKGTLSSFIGGTNYYDGTYEFVTNCTIEYLNQ